MGFKKSLGMGIMSGMLGLALVGGATYAYFSDTETSTYTFAAGTLDLSVNPTEFVNLDNLKPGDSMSRTFELINKGSLNIKDVTLKTDYTLIDAKGDNTEDFAKHIQVEFLYNMDKLNEVVYETTLADLKNMTPDAVADNIFGNNGLAVGDLNDLVVKFNFVDNGNDQNQFQGDSLKLTWTFVANQMGGEEK
ncbi:TasA family protein [Bacillus sp. OK048]|uniref:TasA family protein n=1 Tax=Bacillus sp. OK048 TaxID=1882761 RepID=UPI00087E584E|nr:TasA family protein [Bacillus sp. OK048]SDM56560.1 camelysin. Metallo peptidase. MEROPS family M73 [Bacillus sp. OK048]